MGLGSAFGRRTIVAAGIVGALLFSGPGVVAATPTMIPPIAADYVAVGGASSPLGNPTSSTLTTPCGNAQYNAFQGGTIAYSPSTGARAVYGLIGADYQQLGSMCGALGLPLTNESPSACVAGGRFNNFQGGRITWTAPTGAQETQGWINLKYASMGDECSPIGLPLNNQSVSACNLANRYNNFQNGRITFGPATGAQETQGWINQKYMSMGAECSPIGLPLNSESPSVCVAGGRFNNFQGGRITWTASTGAQETQGWINQKYASMGYECSPIGLPLNSQSVSACNLADRYNNFQGGRITFGPATGAQETQGWINQKYMSMGAECSVLGLPLNSQSVSACNVADRYNNFQGGRITFGPATGAQETQGLINQKYMSMGAECSVLGLPLNSESPSACIAGGRFNNFQGGRITWSPSTGAHETQGLIGAFYQKLGAECSPLGLPTTDEEASQCTSGARMNSFENGAIEWSPGTGAHSVQGMLYARWIDQCAALGLPLGEAYACGTSTCQNFQSGVLSVPAGSCINTPMDFANHFLLTIGEPDNVFNVQAVVAWEMMEGGNWENTAFYNPIDTTQPYDGSVPINSVGVQAYKSWRDGISANTITIFNGFYGGILAALHADNSVAGEVAVARAVGASPWGTPDFEGLLGASYQPPNPPNVVACSA